MILRPQKGTAVAAWQRRTAMSDLGSFLEVFLAQLDVRF